MRIIEESQYICCCSCGKYVNQKTIFIKHYKKVSVWLCEKCTLELADEIAKHIERGANK